MKTQTIDKKGNRWVWNCGWHLVDSKGQPRNAKRMGHLQFRRAVQLADPSIRADREVLHGMDRPGIPWRRWVNRELMEHFQFGLVAVLATDGQHAIIALQNGEHAKVCFENLSEPKGVPVVRKLVSEKKAPVAKKEPKTPSVNALLAKYLGARAAPAVAVEQPPVMVDSWDDPSSEYYIAH